MIKTLEECIEKLEKVIAEQEKMGFAAGPWIDGPPPKDGEEYFVIKPDGDRKLYKWSKNAEMWNYSTHFYSHHDPIKHAKINMPEED